MIYDSKVSVKPVEENSELMELLENTENRFEFNTMMEATAIVLAEQETNWTRFMEGVGLSELASVMEGEEIVYEGARLAVLADKAKQIFEAAIKKLAQLTSAFIAKVQEWATSAKGFLKKHEAALKGAKLDSFNGYEFFHIECPDYTAGYTDDTVMRLNVGDIDKDKFSVEKARNSLFKEVPEGEAFNDKLMKYFYGTKKKKELTNVSIDSQITILKETSKLRDEARKSYNKAAGEISKIVKTLKKASKKEEDGEFKQAFDILLTYWKAYSNAVTQMHGTYLRVLGHRNRQAMAMCTTAAAKSMKKDKVKEEPKKEEQKKLAEPKNEGFVNTEAFLGAIEFI